VNKPVLYVFAISHYCEKARWALDYQGIDYEICFLAPGAHRVKSKKLGASKSSLPILVVGDLLIQGSSEILDWAEVNKPADPPTLIPQNSEQARQIEQRLDDVLGVHVRRYYYSEALVDYPDTVRPIFTRDLTGLAKITTSIGWGMIRKIMIKGMDLGPEQHLESKALVDQELDWLDGVLSDGRQYFFADKFSRVDITAASLLAPLILPRQHHTYSMIETPPKVTVDCAAWRQRPCLQWAERLYETRR
jgi:glutathione S-transferase